MATETIPQLPITIALQGNEKVWASVPQTPNAPVPWVSQSVTVQQIANLANGAPSSNAVTMRQLLAALANQNLFFTAYQALPSDLSNSYNIAWWHATRMILTDAFITGFLQPAISYNLTQMTALFALAQTFPA